MIEGCDYDACAVELDWLHAAKGRTDLQKHCGVQGSELLPGRCRCALCGFCEGADYAFVHAPRAPEPCGLASTAGGVFLSGMLYQPESHGGRVAGVAQLTLSVVFDQIPHYASAPSFSLNFPREIAISLERTCPVLALNHASTHAHTRGRDA